MKLGLLGRYSSIVLQAVNWKENTQKLVDLHRKQAQINVNKNVDVDNKMVIFSYVVLRRLRAVFRKCRRRMKQKSDRKFLTTEQHLASCKQL